VDDVGGGHEKGSRDVYGYTDSNERGRHRNKRESMGIKGKVKAMNGTVMRSIAMERIVIKRTA
jgi:hypothetical protein